VVWGQSKQNESKTLSQKYPTRTQKRIGGVTQVVACLPSKHEALSSNPSTIKTKQKPKTKLKNKIVSTSEKWVGLEIIMLSKISQIQKDKCCMFSLICKSCIKETNVNINGELFEREPLRGLCGEREWEVGSIWLKYIVWMYEKVIIKPI
jgi:hypothetical protein